MIFYAGPCLLNDDPAEIENAYNTARALYAIDPHIRYRCKLWGGGTTPEKYMPGIGDKGIEVLGNISRMELDADLRRRAHMRCGTEIQSAEQLIQCMGQVDYIWIGARNSQNYALLGEIGRCLKKGARMLVNEVLIKRGPGMTIDEIIGLHDICRQKYGFAPVIIERGINSFTRLVEDRWLTDFDGMIRLMRCRPDIALGFDPSHAGGVRENIFPLVKAAAAIGINRFMLEVYDDPRLTRTDQAQAIGISEFRKIYDYVKAHENQAEAEAA